MDNFVNDSCIQLVFMCWLSFSHSLIGLFIMFHSCISTYILSRNIRQHQQNLCTEVQASILNSCGNLHVSD